MNKSVPAPGCSWVPSLGQKQLQGVALSGTLDAQLPGVPDVVDVGSELATCSILGNVFVHRMEAMEGPILGLMPCHSNAAPGCWAAKQLLWDSLSHFKPQEIVAAAEPWPRAISL